MLVLYLKLGEHFADLVEFACQRHVVIFAMPVVIRYKSFRFFFYSNEGIPREPLHIHVRGQGSEAKFWIKPQVRVAQSDGIDARTLRELAEVVEQNVDLIERKWNEHFC